MDNCFLTAPILAVRFVTRASGRGIISTAEYIDFRLEPNQVYYVNVAGKPWAPDDVGVQFLVGIDVAV